MAWRLSLPCVLRLAGAKRLSCQSLLEPRLLGFTLFLVLSNPTLNETSSLAPCLILAGVLRGSELLWTGLESEASAMHAAVLWSFCMVRRAFEPSTPWVTQDPCTQSVTLMVGFISLLPAVLLANECKGRLDRSTSWA